MFGSSFILGLAIIIADMFTNLNVSMVTYQVFSNLIKMHSHWHWGQDSVIWEGQFHLVTELPHLSVFGNISGSRMFLAAIAALYRTKSVGRLVCRSVCLLVGHQRVSKSVILLQNNFTMHRMHKMQRIQCIEYNA